MIPIYPDHTPRLRNLDDYMIEDKERGDYRLHRSAFTDPALFELEMKHIFEGNWIYLAHESQIPNNNDYYTTHIGRQPVFIALRSVIGTKTAGRAPSVVPLKPRAATPTMVSVWPLTIIVWLSTAGSPPNFELQ